MGLRDRFFTPATARAILSGRIAVGVAVAVALAVAGIPVWIAAVTGFALYGALVLAAMPKRSSRPVIDPFTLGEPWRQLVQGAQGASRKLRSTVDAVPAGPLRDRLRSIAEQIEHGIAEAWEIAKRGDAIDDTIRTLDPTSLRSKLDVLERQATESPSDDTEAAAASVRRQLEAADRLREQRDQTAASLRLAQTRLDELVARASEVRIGAADTDTYARDVDDMVLQLEALRQAVEETRSA